MNNLKERTLRLGSGRHGIGSLFRNLLQAGMLVFASASVGVKVNHIYFHKTF